MTDFGLTRRLPEEALVLDASEGLQIDPEVVGVLTNFQVDAIRFLWKHLNSHSTKRCLYNDSKHMGKRLTLVAFIQPLIRYRQYRVLITCDRDEAILGWIFKLHVFNDSEIDYCVHQGSANVGKRRVLDLNDSSSAITLANYNRQGVDIQRLIQEHEFDIVIFDVSNADSTKHLRLNLDIPEKSYFILVTSQDSDAESTKGLLRRPPRSWPKLRRTNEQHLREFPWLCQRRFRERFEEFKGQRTMKEIFSNTAVKKVQPEIKRPELPVLADDTQGYMSDLLFETDDEATPVKVQQLDFRRSTQSSHLLSTMYLRLSQSFCNTSSSTTTPKDRRRISATIVQDSPDLFASVCNSDLEDFPDDLSQHNETVRDLGLPDDSQDDTTNPFDKSTPLTSSVKDFDVPSQSPIKFEVPQEASIVEDPFGKSDFFEITSNEVFASKIKVTTSQRHKPVHETEEQLKFDAEDDELFTRKSPPRQTTPKRKPITPRSGAKWLSKRNSPRVTTPEKVLAKKRRSLEKLYGSGSVSLRGNLDFSALDDDETQRWDAC